MTESVCDMPNNIRVMTDSSDISNIFGVLTIFVYANLSVYEFAANQLVIKRVSFILIDKI